MKRFHSITQEVVSDMVEVGDIIKALDGFEYAVMSKHVLLGMVIGRREDETGEPTMITLWMVHNSYRGE